MFSNSTIKKVTLAIITSLVGVTLQVQGAINVNFTANNLNYFAETNGTYLLDGSLIRVGQFNVSDLTLQSYVNGGQISQENYASLLAAFIPLNVVGSSVIGAGTSVAPADQNSGAIEFTFQGSNLTFASGKIYALVFDAPTSGAAHSVGVFTGNSSWIYPSDMVNGLPVSPSTDNALTTPLIGTFVDNQDGSLNGWNNTDGNANEFIGQLRLIPIVTIPEPSTVALVGMGLLGTFIVRRRKKA